MEAEPMNYNPDEEEYDLSGELLPCEFCSELFPAGILIEHQTGCVHGDFGQEAVAAQKTDQKTKEFDRSVPDLRELKFREATKITNTEVRKDSNIRDDVHREVIQNKRAHTSVKLNVDDYEDSNSDSTRKVKSNDFSDGFSSGEPIKLRNASSPSYLSKLDNFEVQSYSKEKYDDSDMKDLVLSDEEDDVVESIENFWKRAAHVLKQRLPTKNMNANKSQKERGNEFSAKTEKIKNRRTFDWEW